MCQAVGGTKKDNVCKVDLSVVVVSMAESPGLSEPSQHEGRESASPSVVSNSFPPHGLHRPWDSPGQNTGVCCHSLLQGIFPTQGLNPGLQCRQILYLSISSPGHPVTPRRLPSDVGRGASSTEERPSPGWFCLNAHSCQGHTGRGLGRWAMPMWHLPLRISSWKWGDG